MRVYIKLLIVDEVHAGIGFKPYSDGASSYSIWAHRIGGSVFKPYSARLSFETNEPDVYEPRQNP